MTRQEIRKLDDLFKAAVKRLAKGKCEVCGKKKYLHTHHIIGRRNYQVRWDLENGVALCSGCHKMKIQSAHEDPLWFRGWLEGKRNLIVLGVRANGQRELIFEELKQELKEQYGQKKTQQKKEEV